MRKNLIKIIIVYMFLSVFTISSLPLMSKAAFSANSVSQETQKSDIAIDNKVSSSAVGKPTKDAGKDNQAKLVVAGIVIVIVGMGTLIWAYSVVHKGKGYGLKFIFSLNFFFLFADFLILFCFAVLEKLEIGILVYALIWFVVFFRNAKKSNYIFSLQYTLIQSISAILAIVLFLLVMNDDNKKRKFKVSKLLNS